MVNMSWSFYLEYFGLEIKNELKKLNGIYIYISIFKFLFFMKLILKVMIMNKEIILYLMKFKLY